VWSTTSPAPVCTARRQRDTAGGAAGACGSTRRGALAPKRRAISTATTTATSTAAPTRTSVNSAPSSGSDSSTASIPSSGVATRNATAAAVGTPCFTSPWYSGTTPQEQTGSGSPSSIPAPACRSGPPRRSHESPAAGMKA
jgi:hypothetical protein